MVDILTIVGLIGGVVASIGFLPQVIKTWKTKKTRDISSYMILLWMTSGISWIIYGFGRNDVLIIWPNVTIFLLTAVLLVLKLKYSK